MTVVAVIDTSVWVSAFLNPDGYPARLTKAGRSGNFLIVSSLPLLDELHEVLLRPRVMCKLQQRGLADHQIVVPRKTDYNLHRWTGQVILED